MTGESYFDGSRLVVRPPRASSGQNHIKAWRQSRGLSQKELAKKIGIKAPPVSRWENGAADPSVWMLRRIAQVLEVRVGWLLDYPPGSKILELDDAAEVESDIRTQVCYRG